MPSRVLLRLRLLERLRSLFRIATASASVLSPGSKLFQIHCGQK